MSDISDRLDHLSASGATAQSIRTRRDHARRAARALGGCPSTVTGAQLIAWAAGKRWARETRRSVYNSLRSYFGHLVCAGLVEVDPTLELPRVKACRAAAATDS